MTYLLVEKVGSGLSVDWLCDRVVSLGSAKKDSGIFSKTRSVGRKVSVSVYYARNGFQWWGARREPHPAAGDQ